MNTSKQMIEELEEYFELAAQMRGGLIGFAINLEIAMDEYIAKYFCPADPANDEFKKLFFYDKNMGWGRKMEIFDQIATNHDTKLLNDYPQIMKDIRGIIVARNELAHQFLDFSQDAIK